MTVTLERALAIGTKAEAEPRESGGFVVYLEDAAEASIATKIMEMHHFRLDTTEVASANTLFFAEVAFDDSIEDDDDGEDDGSEDGDDSEEDEDESEVDPAADKPLDGPNSGLDDDGRALKVLASQEAHRFAQKIFTGMLGNENMGGYAAFLQDFDRFLCTHKGKKDISFGGKKSRETEDASVTPEDQERVRLVISDFMHESRNDELPWPSIDTEVAAFETILHYNVEIAKKKDKSGRAGLLSALMKIISGDLGDKIVTAWHSGKSIQIQGLMTQVANKLAAALDKKDGKKEAAATDDSNFTMRPELVTILMKATEGELGEKFFGSFADGDTEKTVALWNEVATKVGELIQAETE